MRERERERQRRGALRKIVLFLSLEPTTSVRSFRIQNDDDELQIRGKERCVPTSDGDFETPLYQSMKRDEIPSEHSIRILSLMRLTEIHSESLHLF